MANTTQVENQVDGQRVSPVWIPFNVTYDQLATAGLTNNITLFNLNAGEIIHAVKILPVASFAGGAIATYTLSVGIAGTLAKYAAAYDVLQAPGATVFQLSTTAGMESQTAATAIKVAAVSTVANLNAATAGIATISVLVSKAF